MTECNVSQGSLQRPWEATPPQLETLPYNPGARFRPAVGAAGRARVVARSDCAANAAVVLVRGGRRGVAGAGASLTTGVSSLTTPDT